MVRDKVIAKIATAYAEGRTRTEVATEIGLSPTQISRIARAAGIPRRPRGKRPRKFDLASLVDRIVEADATGIARAVVAVEFGISAPTVSNVARKAGLLTRPKREALNWRAIIKANPDATAYDLARLTGRSPSTADAAARRLNIVLPRSRHGERVFATRNHYKIDWDSEIAKALELGESYQELAVRVDRSANAARCALAARGITLISQRLKKKKRKAGDEVGR